MKMKLTVFGGNLFILFAALFLFSSCEKEEFKARYDVTCTSCTVSYLKEDYQFVARIKVENNFQFEFDAIDGQKLQVAAFDTTDNTTIKVEIRLNGEVVSSKEATGTKDIGVVAEYAIPRSRK
jgi:hypothetical protein